MTVKLGYAIHFVADMDRAVAFYRDTLGLTLKFASPGWTEFATGETTLALHPASAQNPAGSTHLGFVSTGVESRAPGARRKGRGVHAGADAGARRDARRVRRFRGRAMQLERLSGAHRRLASRGTGTRAVAQPTPTFHA